jgi:hypothetical protein
MGNSNSDSYARVFDDAGDDDEDNDDDEDEYDDDEQ